MLITTSLLERYNGDSYIFYMQCDNTDCCCLIEHEPDFADLADFIVEFIKKLFHTTTLLSTSLFSLSYIKRTFNREKGFEF